MSPLASPDINFALAGVYITLGFAALGFWAVACVKLAESAGQALADALEADNRD